MLSDEALLRYSRQILLPQIDVLGQTKLSESRILILGCGGLGCASATYLAAAGVGYIHLLDFDLIEDSNLQRQVAFSEDHIGMRKAESLAKRLQKLNSLIEVDFSIERAEKSTFTHALKDIDLILDGCDNFQTRFMVNRASVQLAIPLVSAAAIGFQGQLCSFDPGLDKSPCYRCLYPDQASEDQPTCHEAGVIGPLVGTIGSMQALEALKVLLGFGESLVGSLMLLDAITWEQKKIALEKDPACPVCTSIPK